MATVVRVQVRQQVVVTHPVVFQHAVPQLVVEPRPIKIQQPYCRSRYVGRQTESSTTEVPPVFGASPEFIGPVLLAAPVLLLLLVCLVVWFCVWVSRYWSYAIVGFNGVAYCSRRLWREFYFWSIGDLDDEER